MTETKLLQFPCQFPLKIVGKNIDDFIKNVLSTLKPFFPELTMADFSSKLSQNNNYISISVTVSAQSQAQLDDVYQSLSAHPDVIMVL